MTTLQLLGLKHTGKSSVGRQFAIRRGWDFYDLDSLLENRSGSHRTARQIYQEEGKSGFQQREAEAARFIVGRLAQGRAVLAWGGGTATNPAAVAALQNVGVLVTLVDRIEILYERIQRGGRPAFLSAEHPWEDFQQVYNERSALLAALTPHQLDVGGTTVDEACTRLEQYWNTLAPAGKR